MRRHVLIVFLAALAVPAAAQWRFAAPMDVPVTPGGTAEINVTTTNQSSSAATGAFLLRGFLPAASGAVYGRVVSSDLRVGCTSQGVVAGNHVMTCFCDPITVESQAVITTKYTISVPLSAVPGTKIEFGLTYQFGGGSTGGRSVAIRVSDAGAPQLRVRLEQISVEDTDDDEVELEYYVVVANVGTAETTGPVDLDVTLSLPYGVFAALLPTGGDSAGFLADGSKFRYRVLETLPPPDENGQVFERYSPPLLFLLGALTRGQYEVIALAAGGGSPPAEARDRFTLEQLMPREGAAVTVNETFPILRGRPRVDPFSAADQFPSFPLFRGTMKETDRRYDRSRATPLRRPPKRRDREPIARSQQPCNWKPSLASTSVSSPHSIEQQRSCRRAATGLRSENRVRRCSVADRSPGR